MKIWLVSDLHVPHPHLGLQRLLPVIPDADVAVFAGDIAEGDAVAAVHMIDELVAGAMPALLVLGNHEFYSRERSMETNRGLAQRAAYHTDGRVHVLDDMSWTIDGVRFLGSTLWSDFQLFGDTQQDIAWAMNASRHTVRDFTLIREHDRSRGPWSPEDAKMAHSRSLVWLDQAMAESEEPVVVVTHHAPSMGSLHPQFERDLASAAFVSRLEDVIDHHQPMAWIHGHTHHSFDYQVGETRIVCNPHGYGMENASRWNPKLVIEIDPPAPRPRW